MFRGRTADRRRAHGRAAGGHASGEPDHAGPGAPPAHQGPGRPQPARTDRRAGPVGVRAVLLGDRHLRRWTRAVRPRGRQRPPGRPRRAPPVARVARAGSGLGRVAGGADRHGGQGAGGVPAGAAGPQGAAPAAPGARGCRLRAVTGSYVGVHRARRRRLGPLHPGLRGRADRSAGLRDPRGAARPRRVGCGGRRDGCARPAGRASRRPPPRGAAGPGPGRSQRSSGTPIRALWRRSATSWSWAWTR